MRPKTAAVVVLGDLGRSPRMLYHSLSLAKLGCKVNLIGYGGSELPLSVQQEPLIKPTVMPELPSLFQRLPRIAVYFVKAVFQALVLLVNLPWRPVDLVVVQNPPAVPSVSVCFLYSLLTFGRSSLVVDWHNYGDTILSLALPKRHPLVRITRLYETVFGRMARLNFCVTKAMMMDLQKRGVKATVVYDKPAAVVDKLEKDERRSFLKQTLGYDGTGYKVVVSSTSWTEDEDFGILFHALQMYERDARDHVGNLPNLLCVITGRGPMKDYYLKLIEEKEWQHVHIFTPWLAAEDYPTMLACADVGVSLHASSSGLDLPMKVVDMFGCGLPVFALDFQCLEELVLDGINGRTFCDDKELHAHLSSWAKDSSKAEQYAKSVQEFRKLGWDENWQLSALPAIENAVQMSSRISTCTFWVATLAVLLTVNTLFMFLKSEYYIL